MTESDYMKEFFLVKPTYSVYLQQNIQAAAQNKFAFLHSAITSTHFLYYIMYIMRLTLNGWFTRFATLQVNASANLWNIFSQKSLYFHNMFKPKHKAAIKKWIICCCNIAYYKFYILSLLLQTCMCSKHGHRTIREKAGGPSDNWTNSITL